MASQKTNQDQ